MMLNPKENHQPIDSYAQDQSLLPAVPRQKESHHTLNLKFNGEATKTQTSDSQTF